MNTVDKELLFSYGTLQQENVQLETFGRLLVGQKDSLLGYVVDQVRIKDPAVLAASGKEFHPILKKTDNLIDEVAGTVFEISHAELLKADGYEVDDYMRIAASTKSGRTVWIYADARQLTKK